eukprot:CAMPEP_0206153416 /NCGR_PEP_ID=MMETSP1474-20131121/625_1 /ASSEMBLY_ACC=CAM_ASM_001110 /TAXON_ID=97495 /ORGANISM="Imantonia sp., Strain RCC918" /LENGTH=155 /DNA_ID=CAMNT_0053551225 /DNA_START=196 /DNA_END=658 /DNA_ORIENTATION=-
MSLASHDAARARHAAPAHPTREEEGGRAPVGAGAGEGGARAQERWRVLTSVRPRSLLLRSDIASAALSNAPSGRSSPPHGVGGAPVRMSSSVRRAAGTSGGMFAAARLFERISRSAAAVDMPLGSPSERHPDAQNGRVHLGKCDVRDRPDPGQQR